MTEVARDEEAVRATVAGLLRRSGAHAGLAALDGLEPAHRGLRAPGQPHSAWELVEHLRRAARDLVDYVERDDYAAPRWPDDYWPETAEPPSAAAWDEAVADLRAAVERMASLVEDRSRSLTARVPTADDDAHHLLRAALLLVDHDAYHLGQLVAARRALGAWPPAD